MTSDTQPNKVAMALEACQATDNVDTDPGNMATQSIGAIDQDLLIDATSCTCNSISDESKVALDKSSDLSGGVETKWIELAGVATGLEAMKNVTISSVAVPTVSVVHTLPCPEHKTVTLVPALTSYDPTTASGPPLPPYSETDVLPSVVTSIAAGHLTNEVAATPDCACENMWIYCWIDLHEKSVYDSTLQSTYCSTHMSMMASPVRGVPYPPGGDLMKNPLSATSTGPTSGVHLLTRADMLSRAARKNYILYKCGLKVTEIELVEIEEQYKKESLYA